MKRCFLALTLLALCFTGCKESNAEALESNSQNNAKEPVKKLEINFSFKTNKEDVFRITMNNIQVDELQKKNIQLFEKVPPSSEYENIVAKFDHGNMSNSIVFNLGNKEIKRVSINAITISYNNEIVEISTAEDIKNHLVLSKYIDFEEESKTLVTKRVDQKHFPTFSLSKKLLRKLNDQ